MAPKKRKGRKPARSRATQKMSPNDSHTSQSARPSTDGARSAIAASDDPPTAMTSVVDTEEELSDNHLGSMVADDEFETASIYPTSQFPRTASMNRSGGHFIAGDSRTVASDLASSTRSLWAMDLDYREIHGRRYCREYYMPNDDLEQLRLTLQHQVFLHILDGELTLAPLEDPEFILDIGTGTGEWAIRMAELYPECEVVGTDISAIAETSCVPINVFFEIEDAEDWDRPPNYYDMIHLRWLAGSFRDWAFMYDNVYYSLKPGGWIEILDFSSLEGLDVFFSHYPSESPIRSLFRDLHIAMNLSGRAFDLKHLDPHVLMDAGFVDIRVTDYPLPINFGENSIGKLWLMACLDGFEAISLRLLTEQMGWDPDDCKAACEQVARETAHMARNPESAKELIVKLRVAVARKPLQSSGSEPWPREYSASSAPESSETQVPSDNERQEDRQTHNCDDLHATEPISTNS